MAEEPVPPDSDDELANRYADIIVDALVHAGVIPDHAFERAHDIVVDEILARRVIGDR